MLPENVELRVSSINLEQDVKAILDLMNDLESVVHTNNKFMLDSNAVYGMGWYFYELSMNAELVKKLIDVYGKEVMKTKGKNVERKFTNWFMKKLKERNCEAQIKLKSERSSEGSGPGYSSNYIFCKISVTPSLCVRYCNCKPSSFFAFVFLALTE